MPEGSRVCLLCGREVPAAPVELEPAGPPGAPPSGEPVVHDSHGPGRNARGLLAIGAAVLVLVVLVVFLAGGGDGDGGGGAADGDADAAVSPTTTRPPSATTGYRRDRPSPTSAVATTTSVPPPAAPVTSTLGPVPGPVLGEPTGGLSLYLAAGRMLTRIELDTGRVTSLPQAFGPSGFTHSLVVAGDTVWIGRENTMHAAPLDLSSGPAPSHADACCWQQGALAISSYTGNGMTVVTATSPDGSIAGEWRMDGVSGSNPLAVIGDQLLVQSAGRLYLVRGDGVIEHYAVGDYVASSGDRILWRGCDERMVCALRLGDADRADGRVLGIDAGSMWHGPWNVQLAPDGRTVAVGTDSGDYVLIDVASGERVGSFDSGVRVAWSPDGAWVFGRSPAGGRLVAVSTRDGVPVEFGPRLPTDGQEVLLAVG